MEIETVPLHRVIAEFMSASTPVEKYLRQGGPLTAQELDSLSLTITSLQTFLDTWKRKNEVPPRGTESLLRKWDTYDAELKADLLQLAERLGCDWWDVVIDCCVKRCGMAAQKYSR